MNSEDALLQALETDKTNSEKNETKTEATENKGEAKVETTEAKTETTTTSTNPWYKDLEFESEDQVKEFVKTAKSTPPKPTFASTQAEAYNNWVANGGVEDFGVFDTVQKFATSENPTVEDMVKALVLKRTIEDPDYKGKESILEKRIKKEFMLDMDAEVAEDDEKEEAEMKLIDLKKEFKKSADYFNDLRKKSEVKVDETLQNRLKEGPAKLKEHLSKLAPDFKIDILKRNKNDKNEVNFADPVYSIKFDENMQKQLIENYEALAKESNFPDLSDGSHEEMKAKAAGWTVLRNFQHIMNDVWDAAVAHAKSENVKTEIEDTNPSAVGTHEKKTVTTEKADRTGEIFK